MSQEVEDRLQSTEAGVTELLAAAIRIGCENALTAHNARQERRGQRKVTTVGGMLLKIAGEDGPRLKKRYQRLDLCEKGAHPGGITQEVVKAFCSFIRQHGGREEDAHRAEQIYTYKYEPIRAFLRGQSRGSPTLQKDFEAVLAGEKARLKTLSIPEARGQVVRSLLQGPMLRGAHSKSFQNLELLLAISACSHDRFGLNKKAWDDFHADVLISGRHVLQRLGYEAEESWLANRMRAIGRATENDLLKANWLAHLHSKDMLSSGSAAALELLARTRNLTLAGAGSGRFFVYAAESHLHRGHDIDASPDAFRMPLREVLYKASRDLIASGDIDGAMRCRTVVARGLLWRGAWEAALVETSKIWIELRALRLDLPFVEMRLNFKDYVAHTMAKMKGIALADVEADKALSRAISASSRANAPIMTASHIRQFRQLSDKYDLALSLEN